MINIVSKWKEFIGIALALSVMLIGCTAAQRPAPQPSQTTNPPVYNNLANKVIALAQQVAGVEEAVVVVIGNIAIIGIDVSEQTESDRSQHIKNAVAQTVESDSRFVEAYVTANPDIYKRIRVIANSIAKGKSISQFLEEITDLFKEIRPQR